MSLKVRTKQGKPKNRGEERVCGTCKWREWTGLDEDLDEEVFSGWMCGSDSTAYALEDVDYDNYCDCWEGEVNAKN